MHRIVSRDEWLVERAALLTREKELTRLKDQISAQRRELPWVKLDKSYVFEASEGPVTLADLFEGRSQLFVQHFMFAPEWEAGCVGCSFGADHVDAARRHFERNDLSYAAVSRAPIEKLEAYRRRMGWRFRWVSSGASDFNYDFNVSFRPETLAGGEARYNYAPFNGEQQDLAGVSVFVREGGDVFHAYSCYARGDEALAGAYNYLDMVPKGRNENGPNYNLMDWVSRHDEYEGVVGAGCCHR
ncbi:MAG TPA: thioredoxin family protein [Caulobacterales bacterium]|nr:thioredoxin family protein [Caulobacterales bacterium]